MSQKVAAIFDIGKTNHKFFLVDQSYHILHEHTEHGVEITDEDGFPSEDLGALQDFMSRSLQEALAVKDFEIRAVNVSAYGASMVHVDDNGRPVTPLYNYLKPYPLRLDEDLYAQYGGKDAFLVETASPALGSLNSALQLYRICKTSPEVFKRILHSFHLPQYLASLLHGNPVSEMTSIGCHTALWDFNSWDYHTWVKNEGLMAKFPGIIPTDTVYPITVGEHTTSCGIGVHDSSSSLLPYLHAGKEPFLLLSTGTWSICLNPFQTEPLTLDQLGQDCLNYISVQGKPVRASRLFAGKMYADGVKKLSAKYQKSDEYFNTLRADREKLVKTSDWLREGMPEAGERDMDADTAYYHFMSELVRLQVRSINLIGSPSIQQIFVEGGFCGNEIFMYMLANAFPHKRIYAATLPQASALGAAMVIHSAWNDHAVPSRGPDFRLFPPVVNS
jgi:sugar (pentulose or hexulose) kinase